MSACISYTHTVIIIDGASAESECDVDGVGDGDGKRALSGTRTCNQQLLCRQRNSASVFARRPGLGARSPPPPPLTSRLIGGGRVPRTSCGRARRLRHQSTRTGHPVSLFDVCLTSDPSLRLHTAARLRLLPILLFLAPREPVAAMVAAGDVQKPVNTTPTCCALHTRSLSSLSPASPFTLPATPRSPHLPVARRRKDKLA